MVVEGGGGGAEGDGAGPGFGRQRGVWRVEAGDGGRAGGAASKRVSPTWWEGGGRTSWSDDDHDAESFASFDAYDGDIDTTRDTRGDAHEEAPTEFRGGGLGGGHMLGALGPGGWGRESADLSRRGSGGRESSLSSVDGDVRSGSMVSFGGEVSP